MTQIYKWILILFITASYSQNNNNIKLDSLKRSLRKGDLNSKYKTLTILQDEYVNFDLVQAMFYGKQCLSTAQILKNDNYIALSYNMIANVFQYKTELDSAMVYHNKALFLRKKSKDSLGIADSYNNLGILYDTKGQFMQAINYYFKALYFYEKKGDLKKQAMTMTNIGIVYKAQKEFAKALLYYRKAYDLYVESKSEVGIVISSGNLGSILINFQKYKEALYYSNLAIEGYKKLGYDRYVPYPMENVAVVYDSLYQFKNANKNYIQAIKLHEANNNLFEVAESANAYANCLMKQKRFLESIAAAEKAKSFAQKSKSHLMEVIANNILSNANGKIGNYQAAYKFSRLYLKGKDSLFENEKTKAIFELETKYQTAKKEKLLLQKEVEAKKRNQLILGLIILSFFVGLIGFLIYRQQKLKNKQQTQAFELKQAIGQIETQNKLQSQRLAISKDLHDNIGAQLTFIISSVETAKFAPEIENTQLGNKLTKISDFTKDTIVELRDTIWAMNSNEISFEELQSRILNFIEKANIATENIDFNFNIDYSLDVTKLTSIVGMNIYRTIQEAVNNSLKYAKATEISVDIKSQNDKIVIEIADNGIGFDKETIIYGNGLNNMQKRIEEIGGTFNITSETDNGTLIVINI